MMARKPQLASRIPSFMRPSQYQHTIYGEKIKALR